MKLTNADMVDLLYLAARKAGEIADAGMDDERVERHERLETLAQRLNRVRPNDKRPHQRHSRNHAVLSRRMNETEKFAKASEAWLRLRDVMQEIGWHATAREAQSKSDECLKALSCATSKTFFVSN